MNIVKPNPEWFADDALNILLKLGNDVANRIKPAKHGGEKIKILDVACGPGGNCAMAMLNKHKDRNIEITAIDYNTASIIDFTRHVKKLVQSKDFETPKAELLIELMDANNLKKEYKEDGIFDYVAGVGAFSNFYEPCLAVKELSRVLKNKGQLILGDFFIPQAAQESMKEVSEDKYKRKRPYIDYHELVDVLIKGNFIINSYSIVTWAYGGYPKKEKFINTLSKWEKNRCLALHTRKDGEKVIVYYGFLLIAEKRSEGNDGNRKKYDFKTETRKIIGSVPINASQIGESTYRTLDNLYGIACADLKREKHVVISDLNVKTAHFDIICGLGALNVLRSPDERRSWIAEISRLLKTDGKLVLGGYLEPLTEDVPNLLDYYDVINHLHEADFDIKYYRPEQVAGQNYFLLVAEKIREEDKKTDVYNLPDFKDLDFISPEQINALCNAIKEEGLPTPSECTIDGLNQCLENNDLSILCEAEFTELDKIDKLPHRIKYGINKVRHIDNFSPEENKHNLKLLNRFILEYKIPETPKLSIDDDDVWEIWDH